MIGGQDHEVQVGPGDTVVRRRRPGADGLDVAAEAALLARVAEVAPVPVPRVLAVSPAEQLMVMERIPGEPLLHSVPGLSERAARVVGGRLGRLVAALGAVPPEDLRGVVPEESASLEAHHAGAVCILDHLGTELPAGLVGAAADFLTLPLPEPAPPRQLCHNDLGSEHVFVDEAGTVTGVLDWSDASIGDPCLDLGLVWRDLGEPGFRAALAHVAGADREGLVDRARVFAVARALEDFEFGLEPGREVHLHNAVRALRHLLGLGPVPS